jgi:hypothetical protein
VGISGKVKKLVSFILLAYPIAVVLFSIFYSEQAIGDITARNLAWSVIITIPILMMLFTIDAVRNKKLTQHQRRDWILGIILFPFYALPFYWYHHIWHETKTRTSYGTLE